MLHGKNGDNTCKFSKKKLLVPCFVLSFFLYYCIHTNTKKNSELFVVDQEHSNNQALNTTILNKLQTVLVNPTSSTVHYKTNANDLKEDSKLFSSKILDFDINSNDIIVFLHMQKTGGTTFGLHLVRDLESVRCIKKPDTPKQRYHCYRPNADTEWLFSRYSTGWKCGVHADWTSLNECIPDFFADDNQENKRYFYITVLRDPVTRYLSEWLHVARGATWDDSYQLCNGDYYEYPCCWNGSDWRGVTLDEFMDCHDNVANNRQTKMLADIRRINCTGLGLSEAEKNEIILKSAKKNLKDMVFFGITEQQEKTQALFEFAFNLKFRVKLSMSAHTKASNADYSNAQIERLTELNSMDIELYKFAIELFQKRYEEIPFA